MNLLGVTYAKHKERKFFKGSWASTVKGYCYVDSSNKIMYTSPSMRRPAYYGGYNDHNDWTMDTVIQIGGE